MSDSFEIRASSHTYKISITPEAITGYLADRQNAFIVCDEIFTETFRRGNRVVVGIKAVEDGKTLDVCAKVVETLRDHGFGRGDHLIAIGGGIVQDVACFVASVYMRGVHWAYCPTTLLGMADSCIGGKSSINVGKFKNLAGTFHPPDNILIDSDFVRTLSPDQFVGGLCEAAKICFVHSREAFTAYMEESPKLGIGVEPLTRVIGLSLKSKKWFIEVDEFDRNERLTLNFGHTFGHAIEAATGFSINHGLAVGVGVLCALDFAKRETGVSNADTERLEAHFDALLSSAMQPHMLATLNREQFERAFMSDKKHERDVYCLILPVENGPLPLARLKFPRTSETIEKMLRSLDTVVARVTA